MAESKIIFDLQLAFRKNLSTVHALINLLKSIRQALDKGFMACGIFADLQKAFDQEIQQNLFIMVFVVSRNDWLKSYLLMTNSMFL